MGRSVVYFTDMRATPERNLLQKFRALIERAGIEDINFEKQFTAIKIHLGEPGNIAYLARTSRRSSRTRSKSSAASRF